MTLQSQDTNEVTEVKGGHAWAQNEGHKLGGLTRIHRLILLV